MLVPGRAPLTCVITLYASPGRGRAMILSPSGGTPDPMNVDACTVRELKLPVVPPATNSVGWKYAVPAV